MTGGSLSAGNYEGIGDYGPGAFQQSGGINSSTYLNVANYSSGGAYNLSGGSLWVPA